VRAVTFDFWNTLVDGAITPTSTSARVARLHEAVVGAGYACSVEELTRAFQSVTLRLDEAARESAEEVGPPGRWAAMARELGIPDGAIAYEVVERAYDDITLNPAPAMMPRVDEAVQAMKAAGYRLGVICNTGMAGGRVLREVLRRHKLLDAFEVTVFSNELGVPKPHPAIFEHTLEALGGIPPGEALHVGDVENLDVEGARRAGMHSALYAPGSDASVETDADFVVRDWRDFGGQVARFIFNMPDGA
jgi:putative hydrolase of the HAD superfamily